VSDSPLKPVTITKDAVIVDGVELPSSVIEKNGVVVKPGGAEGINRLVVTFLVGEVDITDPTGWADDASQ
jgi:hypothetical protein